MGRDTGQKSFIPGLGYHRLTAFYDPVLALLLREATWKAAFVDQIAPEAGDRILDLGCGTGTLAILIKQAAPGAEVLGLDPDPEMLRQARHKASEAGVTIALVRGFADDLGAPGDADRRYDKVVSSLMLHHLDTGAKRRALEGARAWLRPAGELHVADFGRPENLLMRSLFLAVQLDDGFTATRDNVLGRLPQLIAASGFAAVTETRRLPTALGTLSFYRAKNPGPGVDPASCSRDGSV